MSMKKSVCNTLVDFTKAEIWWNILAVSWTEKQKVMQEGFLRVDMGWVEKLEWFGALFIDDYKM